MLNQGKLEVVSERFRSKRWRLSGAATVLLLITIFQRSHAQESFDRGQVFDEAWNIVHEKFVDPTFHATNWVGNRETWRRRAIQSVTHDDFASVMNEMLGTLKTSHTHYYSRNEPRHYQLLGVFDHVIPNELSERFTYPGIGIESTLIDGKHFALCVYEGLPAYRAGIRIGDEIVSVDRKPFHALQSFEGRAGQEVPVEIRDQDGQTPRVVQVKVESLNGRTMFLSALESSIQTIERNRKRIGYVHLWSYAGDRYHSALRNAILWGDLAACESVIIDLRDGWGGANPEYVSLFREPTLKMAWRVREGDISLSTDTWGKPVALLVNERTTSGKELYTYLFKKLKLGKVIGTKTAGAVVGGGLDVLSNGDALYVAVMDLKVDGIRLEGVGVSPDIEIGRPIPYTHGNDPQLEAALDFLSQSSK